MLAVTRRPVLMTARLATRARPPGFREEPDCTGVVRRATNRGLQPNTRTATVRQTSMNIPTEPVGSVPRPPELIDLLHRQSQGEAVGPELGRAYEAAPADTMARFDATGSPVLADGEQFKASFASYPLVGLTNLAPDGVVIPISDGLRASCPD